ncbi:MAG TPA: adenylate/guanylate cyclase domain-containing protein, partial [Pyrinomonadaceae bacterium]
MHIIYSYEGQEVRRDFELSSLIIGRPLPGQRIDLDLTPDEDVSRLHAQITCVDGQCYIEDLGSRGGTWVNGKKISAKTKLSYDATVQVGRTLIGVRSKDAQRLAPEGDGSIQDVVDATQPVFSATESDEPPSSAQRQLKAFYEFSQTLGHAASLDELLRVLTEQIRRALPQARRGAVLLRGPRGDLLLKSHWPEGQPSVSMTWAERASRECKAFTWTAGGEVGGEIPNSVRRHGVRSAAYAPMLWEGRAVGVLYVDAHGTHEAFTPSDRELLRAAANQAAMFVRIRSLEKDLRREESLRSNLLRRFPPKVAERLIGERGRPWLGGERVDVTVLVSDIRGFTAMTEHMEPDDVVMMLNEMFGAFVPIVFKYDGTVDKYVGDALLAVFGSPEPDDRQAEKAVRAALEMQDAARAIAKMRQGRGQPVCRVGIGINSGEALHGFIGTPEQMEYTVIGDVVNRASRFCDGAGGGEVVISKGVYEHVFHSVEVKPKAITT